MTKNKTLKTDLKDSPSGAYSDLEKSFKKRGLGRGLNALFEDEEKTYPQVNPQNESSGTQRRMIAITQLAPGVYQPRTIFNDKLIEELSASMKEHGVLQPLLVRAKASALQTGSEEQYEIIAGERRWRAAQKAGLHEIPVIIKNLNDQESLEIGLIENLQREDLNPLDEARALQQLIEEFDYTQSEAANAMGKSRPYVANMVRLMSLPEGVQGFIKNGSLSAGHARALITSSEPEALAQQIINDGLTVRDAEKLAKSKKSPKATKKSSPSKDVNTVALENEISDKLGLSVGIDMKNNKEGKLSISFKDLDQLDTIVHRLTQTPYEF